MQEDIRKKILCAAMKIVPFEGWAGDLIPRVTQEVNLEESAFYVIFPKGVLDLLEYYIEQVDHLMMEKYQDRYCTSMNTADRIKSCVIARLEVLNIHKNVTARTVSFLALPMNYKFAFRTLWKTVDKIWYEAGQDQSHDFNYYTKRMTLSAIYSTTLLYWLDDDSLEMHNTNAFLQRRLEETKYIGMLKKKIREFL